MDEALARDGDGAGPCGAAAATVGEDVEYWGVELGTTAMICQVKWWSVRDLWVASFFPGRRRGIKGNGGTNPEADLARLKIEDPRSGREGMLGMTWFGKGRLVGIERLYRWDWEWKSRWSFQRSSKQ